MTASFELPDAARKDVKINYVIDSNGVDFADVPDNKKRAQLDCMVIAFDSFGKRSCPRLRHAGRNHPAECLCRRATVRTARPTS